MTSAERPAILLLAPGAGGDRLTGPVIRVMEIARALAGRHSVTVAFRGDPPAGPEGLRIIRASRMRMLREALKHDVVMAPWLPPFLIPVLHVFGVISVSDLYDPIEHELASAEGDAAAAIRLAQELTALQLRFADLVTCGGARQREHLLCKAPRARRQDDRLAPIVVPFGVPDPPPRPSGHPLRELLGLGASDFVVLWWGNVWRWLDPGTAIRAAALLKDRLPDLRLVFSGGVPADPAARALTKTGAARDLAESLQVSGRSVLFLDAWVPYEERHRYLGDANLGITLHADPGEAQLAARARYLDYLWCSLPPVLSAGDEFAETLAANGFGTLVKPGDVRAVAAAIERLADDPTARGAAALAGAKMASGYRWPAVVEPLSAAIGEALETRRRRYRHALKALPPTLAYYARRALERPGARPEARG